jgi:hypothetical protein
VAPHIKVLITMPVVLTLKQRLISAQMKKVQTDHLLVITSVIKVCKTKVVNNQKTKKTQE